MVDIPTRPAAVQPGAVLRLRLIGQMEAWTLGSQSVLPTGRKTRALLAIVALSSPRPALRGRLAEMLWSRRPEEQARASLRQELHRLLETLAPAGPDVLQVTRDHVGLRPGAAWIDVEEVMRATVEHPAALGLLEGDLLEDLDGLDPTFDMWLATERERLRDRGRALAERLLAEKDDPESTIPAAQRLLAIDRAHEGAWRALMRAHAARGERGMAIQAYDRCRAVLADLLDAAPSQETQKLLAEIRGPSGSRLPLRPPPLPPPRIETPADASSLQSGNRGGAHIGVLPFQLVGTSGEDGHLATGLADEITNALSRLRWLFVVSSGSLARFAEESRDEAELRAMFGLDFVLDGTVQRVRDRLRITARLLDLRANSQVVWARRFDRSASDLLSLQDEIAAEVVAQIDPEILLIEARRSAAQAPSAASAYDLLLRALPQMNRMEREPFTQAGAYLQKAIEADPDYAAAHAWRAYWHVFLVGQGWAAEPEAAMAEAGKLAERAIQLDPMDARALTIAGHVRAFLDRELLDAIALHERALALNPNLAMAWALSAIAHAYFGDIAEAERRITRYKRLSPLDPYAFIFDGFFTIIRLLQRDFEAAVTAGRNVTQMNPGLSAGYKAYLAALGHLGRRQEAAAVLKRLRALEPDFTVSKFLAAAPFAREVDRDIFAQGLRLAGTPETSRDAAGPKPAAIGIG
ncbi:MAG TPA: BTAD domain-containing putative transcriptional regulator [Acetobacteraceae bacterium]|nr:BTAD domain-containing putative transcriptional regulator [Acetobacteraceae bacterium]